MGEHTTRDVEAETDCGKNDQDTNRTEGHEIGFTPVDKFRGGTLRPLCNFAAQGIKQLNQLGGLLAYFEQDIFCFNNLVILKQFKQPLAFAVIVLVDIKGIIKS